MKSTINTIYFTFLISILMVSSSCKKQLEVSAPIYSTNEETVYKNDNTAVQVLAGIYGRLSGEGLWSISLTAGLSADELTLFPNASVPELTAYYKNTLTASNIIDYDYWRKIYPYVYYANSAINGLAKSSTLTPSVKNQLLGEAKFIRALCYFYLVNLYGKVPLAIGTDYNVNRLLPRASESEVYSLIINDLSEAENLLSTTFLDGTVSAESQDRVRPTKWAAEALLARIYLYKQDWVKAENYATYIISANSLFNLSNLNDVFKGTGSEAIWQLLPVNFGQNTQDAPTFVIPSTGFTRNQPVYLSDNLIKGFEPGDMRRRVWVDSVNLGGTIYRYPSKYRINKANQPVTEYTMVLRVGEQYLIRAEARINQDKISDGVADLNKIRDRARDTPSGTVKDPLPPLSPNLSKADALAAVLHERQIELFTEWGNRWLDLKRTSQINNVMNSAAITKGTTWDSNWQLYPIRSEELNKSPNIMQNSGY